MQPRVAGLPGLPETRFMPCPIACIPQPVQLHAERLQVLDRRGLLRMPAQQADGGKAETLARRRQRVEVIGVRATETDDAFGPQAVSSFQVFDELEPFVAADQRVDLVQPQDRHFDAGSSEPVEVKGSRGLEETNCLEEKA